MPEAYTVDAVPCTRTRVPGATPDRQCGSAQQAVHVAAQQRVAPYEVPVRIEVGGPIR